MSECAGCGHALGDGRFCPSCGREVDPSPPSSPPPPPPERSSRYPLFADEIEPTVAAGAPAAMPPSSARVGDDPEHRPAPGWLPWVVGAVVVVLLAGGGVFLLLGGLGDDGSGTAASDTAGDTPDESANESAGTSQPGAQKNGDRRRGSTGAPVDVAASASVTVPATAEPNQDVGGEQVSYEASRMLDGVGSTAWRMPGDGTGEELAFGLDRPTRITEVGLVNGYAKTAADGTDWYAANRRVLRVEWSFDDGTTLTQELVEGPERQTVSVPRARSETVRLRLLEVTEPGRSPRRDYTAISDVVLVGRPA